MSERLYQLLSEHLTPRKREVFERVVNQRTRHLTLVMEDIYQTQNASAIFRSLEAWGVQDVHVIENTHSLSMHRRIAKGSGDWLTIHRYNETVNNTETCLRTLKAKGYRIIATAFADDAVPLEQLDITEKTAIVMGTELTGISTEVETMADQKLIIPMSGFTESLNVSVAAAVIMQHLVHKLKSSTTAWQLSDEEKLALKIEWARKSIYWSEVIVKGYEETCSERNRPQHL